MTCIKWDRQSTPRPSDRHVGRPEITITIKPVYIRCSPYLSVPRKFTTKPVDTERVWLLEAGCSIWRPADVVEEPIDRKLKSSCRGRHQPSADVQSTDLNSRTLSGLVQWRAPIMCVCVSACGGCVRALCSLLLRSSIMQQTLLARHATRRQWRIPYAANGALRWRSSYLNTTVLSVRQICSLFEWQETGIDCGYINNFSTASASYDSLTPSTMHRKCTNLVVNFKSY